jgi:lipopolysaccharide/colanic/teichoic acid biosynthesis glycosyltransferase
MISDQDPVRAYSGFRPFFKTHDLLEYIMSISPSPQMTASTSTDILMRGCDLILAVVFLLLFLVPMMIIATLIYLEDRSDPFFYQQRIGRGCRPFKIVKFRTMHVDPNRFNGSTADPSLAGTVHARQKFQTTVPNDPRITRVGRILRPTHLDELPQVANVLLGQMSFVGVRPDVPVQVSDYTPQQWVDRHVARPGITGLAQVSSDIDSTAQRTAYDLQWVAERSLPKYLNVILRTVGKVLRRNSL